MLKHYHSLTHTYTHIYKHTSPYRVTSLQGACGYLSGYFMWYMSECTRVHMCVRGMPMSISDHVYTCPSSRNLFVLDRQ